MPEMDGVTATRQFRAIEAELGDAHLPIIAMTANALQEDRERCFAAGMDGYISKPISLTALQGEIHRLFGGKVAAAPASSPAIPATSNGAIFDRAAAIAMMGDEELFEQLAEMYIADYPGYLRELEAAATAADKERLGRAAHTLKGLFATFVAPAGESLAKQLEQAARNGDFMSCGEMVVALRTHTKALAGALKA
jgi:two-component system sensor histidine kinase/response regulator